MITFLCPNFSFSIFIRMEKFGVGVKGKVENDEEKGTPNKRQKGTFTVWKGIKILFKNFF